MSDRVRGSRAEEQTMEHVVTRVNDGWYVCDRCGQTGSERWAILHQFPSKRRHIGLRG